nr:phosphate ABC transporter substrate-binding/OmpA family protein [uncultured Celeribacter sp.]
MSRDSSIAISGTLLSFDGQFYRVDTEFGVLTVDSSGVRCEGPGCPDLEGYFAQIRISGDPAGTEALLPALITAFALRNGYQVEEEAQADGAMRVMSLIEPEDQTVVGEFLISETSNGEGFADLMGEAADMALSLRPVTEEERGLAVMAGVGDLFDPHRARVIALDALVPVVSRSNLVNALSLLDLTQIYTGQTSNWSALGGADAPIVAHVVRDDLVIGSRVRQMLLPAGAAETVVVHDDYAALVAAVEQDPYAVGLARLSSGGAVKPLGLTGGCGFEAAATAIDIKSEDYPMTRPVFLYTPARRLPTLAREFLRYVVSPEAQLVVARTPFADQGVEEVSFRGQGQRFANAIRHAGDEISLSDLQQVTSVLQGARRLTLGFRFEGGSVRLDAQSRSNVRLLAELLEAGVYDGKRLSFVGFSDAEGTASVNQALSKRRANAVLIAVQRSMGEAFQADRLTFATEGFGEAMPLACNDVDWGRLLNRRVELWVSDQR